MAKKILHYTFYALVVLVAGVCIWGYQPEKSIETLRAQYAQSPSQFMDLDGLQVHYRDEGRRGDSIPLVLIHGTSSSLFTWNDWVKHLSGDFRIIRLDLPNYALTGSDGHTVHMGPDYAHFMARFLDRLGIRQCYMAGNSLGGEVSWQFARLYPDRVRKIALLNSAGIPAPDKGGPVGFQIAHMPVLREIARRITPRAIFESSVRNVYADPSKVSPELVQLYLDMTAREGNRDALIRRFKMDDAPYDNHMSELSNIKTPALIIWGQQDRLIPVEVAYEFEKRLPNDTLVVFPNAGHVPMEELGEASALALRQWLLK